MRNERDPRKTEIFNTHTTQKKELAALGVAITGLATATGGALAERYTIIPFGLSVYFGIMGKVVWDQELGNSARSALRRVRRHRDE